MPTRERKDTVKVTVAPPSSESDPWPEERTGRGVPHPPGKHPPRSVSPPPFEIDESPSKVHSSREVARLKAELQDEKDRANALEAEQLEGQRRRIPRVELDTTLPPARKRSYAVLKALGVVLGGLLVTLSGYFGLDLKTQLEPKVDATKAVQAVTLEQLKAATDRVDALEQRDRQRTEHDRCIERQNRDAHARGTGQDITSSPRGGTDWAQQRMPSSRPRQIGDPPTWFTVESCPAAPP